VLKWKKSKGIFVKHVKDIEAGKFSVEDCLDRYPFMREQLESLLRTALEIRKRRGNGFGKV
jgi:hypothetical protein